jgi:biotin operon repressor
MAVELDSLTIKDLEARYGVTRSNIYNRINGLKEKGYPMEPEKQAGKSIFNADQVAVMDRLDVHIKGGNEIATFPGNPDTPTLSYVSQDNSQLSYRTQDRLPRASADGPDVINPAAVRSDSAMALALVVDAIAGKLQDLKPDDPLANLRSLEEACDRGWLLSTSQLAALLGVKSLSAKEFSRYGFTFTRVGRNGVESSWRIRKSGAHHPNGDSSSVP